MEQIDDKKIAVIYNKTKLANGFYFLYAKEAVIGHVYEDETGNERLISTNGSVFYPVDNQTAIEQKDTLFYDDYDELANEINLFLTATQAAKGQVITNYDISEVLQCFFESFEEDVLFAQFKEDGCAIHHIDLNKLEQAQEEIETMEMPYAFDDDTLIALLEAESVDEMKNILTSLFGTGEQSKEAAPQILVEPKKIDLQELEDFVNERVIGHQDAVEEIATTLVLNQQTDDYREIERILVAGPTGIGKTETFESIAEYLKVPFVNYAVTTLSDSGLVGKDVEDILKYVYFKANNQLPLVKRAIVVLDEIDKLAVRDNEASQISVQQNLLKLLEGHTFDVQKNFYDRAIHIDTRFMSFIGCGAFPELFQDKKKIGILSELGNNTKTPTLQDFFQFGMIEELMGRFGQIQIYQPLTDLERYQALTVSKISPFLIKQNQFQKHFGVQLQAEESYYQSVLNKTKDSSVGLRSLKSVVNRSLLRLENDLLKHPNVYKEAFVSQETVADSRQYILK